MAHASGPTLRQARCREVRAFQVKTIAGKSRHNTVSLKLRRRGERVEATEATVFSEASAVSAEPASVRLEGSSEQSA